MTAPDSELTENLPGLDALLTGWLAGQRWFGGKGRPVARVVVEELAELPCAGARLLHTIVQVHYSDGQTDRYQVPVTVRPHEQEGLGHALIGVLEEGGRAVLYDATHDPAGTTGLLGVLRRAEQEGGRADVAGLHAVAAQPVLADGDGRLIGAEQSNSSIVYGSALILKLFRRLAPGENPDLEVTRALAEQNCPAVIPPFGWVSAPVAGVETTLMLVQPFVSNSTEGWKLATASVRDLYAEQDLHADEVGGDFAAESRRLGAATAEVHAALASSLPTRTATAEELTATAVGMQERLAQAVEAVSELRPWRDALGEVFAQLGRRPGGLALQRIHGDFHLGQVLRGPDRWLLVDFEGEPATPLTERTALASPLRDVAGMMRSFDYAARSLLGDHLGESHLAYRASEWAERNRAAFCDGYAAVMGTDPRADPLLLRTFELDKAVYEVVYEARNRPSWLPIPLGAIERLAG
jgi:maltokinase